MRYYIIFLSMMVAVGVSSAAYSHEMMAGRSCHKKLETRGGESVAEEAGVSEVDECFVTPLVWDLHPPFEINNSNNLRRKQGSPFFAKGQFIIIEGAVKDENCVPVPDAVVEIWQADALGGVGYMGNGKDKHFNNTGRAITSNNGEYAFYTVMPGAAGNHGGPVIHIRVRHKDFLLSESLMHLTSAPSALSKNEDHVKKNAKYSKLLLAYEQNRGKNRVGDGVRYRFDFTLEGANLYKKY